LNAAEMRFSFKKNVSYGVKVKLMFKNYNSEALFPKMIFFDALEQCFPTFSCSRHTYLVIKIFGSTHNSCYKYKDQEIIAIGCTPSTISQWEPLP